MLVILKNPGLSCRNCLGEGHWTFTCSYFEWNLIVYFAHEYYLHTIKSHLRGRSFQTNHHQDHNFFWSNCLTIHKSKNPFRTEYWRYTNNGPQAATQNPPKNICFCKYNSILSYFLRNWIYNSSWAMEQSREAHTRPDLPASSNGCPFSSKIESQSVKCNHRSRFNH